jgi:hypothetical protein
MGSALGRRFSFCSALRTPRQLPPTPRSLQRSFIDGGKLTYPTSELPISPSLSPTASPCASNGVWLCFSAMASMLVVSAFSMALPLMPFSAAIPHPSWTLESKTKAPGSEHERKAGR